MTQAAPVGDPEKPFNAFETLTLVPIHRRLVEPAMMSAEEITWLDAYHARVRDVLAAFVDATTHESLIAATAPLAR